MSEGLLVDLSASTDRMSSAPLKPVLAGVNGASDSGVGANMGLVLRSRPPSSASVCCQAGTE